MENCLIKLDTMSSAPPIVQILRRTPSKARHLKLESMIYVQENYILIVTHSVFAMM